MPSMIRPSPHHRAPAVQYPVVRSAWLAGALALWSLAGLLALTAWGWLGAFAWPLQVIGGCILGWLLLSMLAWRFWARLPVGMLVWDGQAWQLQSGRVLGSYDTLTVQFDLQRWIGVCLRSANARPQWIWLERQSAPIRWGDLRRAVYSRPGTGNADATNPAPQQTGAA